MSYYSYNYPDEIISVVIGRGYNDAEHRAAIESGNEEAITLTHPYNWLTEEEVEEHTRRWTEAILKMGESK